MQTPGEALRAAILSLELDPRDWDFDQLAALVIDTSDALQDQADRRFEDDGGALASALELDLKYMTERLAKLEKALEILAPQDRARVLAQARKNGPRQ